MFLVRVDKVPPSQSAWGVSALYFDGAGMVSVGMLDLSPKDTKASSEVGCGGIAYSSSLAASMGRRPSKPAFDGEGSEG
jgi:hypothetical protein